MRPTLVWFVCAGVTLLSGIVFFAGMAYFDASIIGFFGELLLVAATALSIFLIGLLDSYKRPIEKARVLAAAAFVLFYGVAGKWKVLSYVLDAENLRILTPGLRIVEDAMMMAAVTTFWLLSILFERHIEPYLFVKPGDRPPPRKSPYV